MQTAPGNLASDTDAAPTRGAALRELPASGKLLLRARGEPAEVSQLCLPVLGFPLPLQPNTVTTDAAGTVEALWLGAGRWLLVLDAARTQGVKSALEQALVEVTCLVAEVSAARAGFTITGPQARDVLSAVCGLDCDPRVFTAGQCAQSLLVRVPVLIQPLPAGAGFRLYVDRSFAAYAQNWLADAVAGVQASVQAGAPATTHA